MSKLVDRERLARLAAALDARMKAAVKAEEQRAMGVEAGLQAAIDAINHAETGILKQANAYTDEKIAEIDEINGNVAGNIGDLQEKDEELAQAIADNKAVLDKLDGAEDVEGSVKKQIKDAVAPVQGKVDALEGRMDAVEEVNGEQNTAIQNAQQAANAADAKAQGAVDRLGVVEPKMVELEGEIDANLAAINKLNGASNEEGSVAKAVEDAVAPVRDKADANEQAIQAMDEAYKAADAKVLADANKYADDAITALVNGAPEAMDTLKELADSISKHQNAYDAYVETVSAALEKKVDKAEGARLILETEAAAYAAKAEVSDVKAAQAAAEAKAAELDAVLAGRLDAVEAKNGEQDTAIQAAKDQADKGVADAAAVALRAQALEEADDRMQGEIDANEQAIANNKAVLDKLDGAVDVEGSVKKQIKDAVAPVQGEVDALEGRMDVVEAKNGEQDTAIQAAQAKADQGVADAAAVAVRAAALEGIVGNKAAEGVEAAGLCKDVADNAAAIQANADAIDVLNGGADEEGSVAKAIADALEPFSTTEEVKAILGNVVNSLSLAIEENKLKLTLGGVEGITLAEQELDMATDADIDAIIAGLDE